MSDEPGRRRGPAPSFTVPEIARAAVALADASGLDAVTMRSVAGALGITAAGLYRYVTSREDLVAQMVDAVSADLRHPDPTGDWMGDLTLVAGRQRDLHRAHPWLAGAAGIAVSMGPHVLDHLEWGLRALDPVDADAGAKLEAIALVNGIAILFAPAPAVPGPAAFAGLDPVRHARVVAQLTTTAPGPGPEGLFDRVVAAVLQEVLGRPG